MEMIDLTIAVLRHGTSIESQCSQHWRGGEIHCARRSTADGNEDKSNIVNAHLRDVSAGNKQHSLHLTVLHIPLALPCSRSLAPSMLLKVMYPVSALASASPCCT